MVLSSNGEATPPIDTTASRVICRLDSNISRGLAASRHTATTNAITSGRLNHLIYKAGYTRGLVYHGIHQLADIPRLGHPASNRCFEALVESAVGPDVAVGHENAA